MTPTERAEELVVPWKESICGRGLHAILDDAELRRRVAELIEAAVAEKDVEIASLRADHIELVRNIE